MRQANGILVPRGRWCSCCVGPTRPPAPRRLCPLCPHSPTELQYMKVTSMCHLTQNKAATKKPCLLHSEDQESTISIWCPTSSVSTGKLQDKMKSYDRNNRKSQNYIVFLYNIKYQYIQLGEPNYYHSLFLGVFEIKIFHFIYLFISSKVPLPKLLDGGRATKETL